MGRAEILHWSPKDYLSDFKTAGLTLHEEGAYRRLLDHMWIGTDEQCVFPLDFLALAAVWRVPSEEAVTLVERLTDGPGAVLKIKHTRDGDVLFSKRLHVQKSLAEKSREKKSTAGKKSGAVRRAYAANRCSTEGEQPVQQNANSDTAKNELTYSRIHVFPYSRKGVEDAPPEMPDERVIEGDTTELECLSQPIKVKWDGGEYEGTCLGYVNRRMEEHFGRLTSSAELAELRSAIRAGCLTDCDGSHARLCAAHIVDKLERKGGPTFAKSRLWLKCVREDRHEVLQP